MISIKRAKTDKDFKAITRLNSSEFEDNLDYTRGWWWVAVDEDGTVVGFAGMQQSRNYERAAYLERAVVRSSFRHRGIHKKLIRAREKLAKRLSYTYLITDTSRLNCGSMNALISCRFKTFLPSNPWANYDEAAVYWVKYL